MQEDTKVAASINAAMVALLTPPPSTPRQASVHTYLLAEFRVAEARIRSLEAEVQYLDRGRQAKDRRLGSAEERAEHTRISIRDLKESL